MDEVFCPEENAFPEARRPKGPFICLNSARYGIAWGALGAAEDCWDRPRQYTLDRMQFGRPLAANQLIQKKLADMQTEITLGLQGGLRLGRMKDEGTAGRDHVAHEAKFLRQVARHRAGRPRHAGWQRHHRRVRCHPPMVNLEVVNTYEGTHDVHALILGRATRRALRRSDYYPNVEVAQSLIAFAWDAWRGNHRPPPTRMGKITWLGSCSSPIQRQSCSRYGWSSRA